MGMEPLGHLSIQDQQEILDQNFLECSAEESTGAHEEECAERK
jgi:hypothetical protein